MSETMLIASGPETLIRAIAPPPEVAGAHIVVAFCTIILYGAKVMEIYLARLSATKVLSGMDAEVFISSNFTLELLPLR